MSDLVVKNVDVMGDLIKAAKDSDGNIWVGVRWICDALDMTEGQRKRQIKNIQKDMAFSQGGSNQIPIQTSQGEQEVFCIRNDFIPLWLAKISITEKTRRERPEFADKLLNYQLKAKDILADAFSPNQPKFPATIPEQIQLLAQGNVALNERVDAVKEEVNVVKAEVENIKSDLPLLPIEADEIVKAVKRKGVEVLGGKQAPAYKNRSLRQRVYNDIYANLKHNFNVKSYKAIRRRDIEKAIRIVNEYKPPVFLADEIHLVNSQMKLDLD